MDFEIFFDAYYGSQEKLILACSAGPDSMYLLYKILDTKYRDNLVVCYFNHKIRKESEEEMSFLGALSNKLSFILETDEADIIADKALQKSISTEELGRLRRYEFFSRMMDKYETDKVILAHHMDDRIETFIFNLIRGSKISGLINMTEKQGNILRPLLKVSKNEILDYLEREKLEYRIDTSNFLREYDRNKIRLDVLPIFNSINTRYRENILNFLDYLTETKMFLDREVITFLNKYDGKYFLVDDFFREEDLLRREIIRYLYYISNGNSTIGLSSANIKEIIRFIAGKNNKTHKEIGALRLEKDAGRVGY